MGLTDRIALLKWRLNHLIAQGHCFTDAVVVELSQDLDVLICLQTKQQTK